MKRRSLRYSVVFLLLILSLGTLAAGQNATLQVQVIGLIDKPQINVQATLQNLKSQLNYPLTRLEVLHFYNKAPKKIRAALAPYGYFNSTIQSKLIQTTTGWLVQFYIQKGPPLKVNSIQVEIMGMGKTDPEYEKLLRKLPIHVGDTLHTERYEKIKTDLYNLATQRGYFNAKMIKNNIIINLARNQASIIIIFDTGNRFRFGKTTFSDSPFYLKFLNRFLQYKEGEYYDAQKVEATQADMIASQFFDQALIKPQVKKSTDDIVNMRVKLIPRKAKEYIAGIGYGTDTGARGTLGVVLRHLNGWGHRFQAIVRGSQEDSSFIMKYLIPGPDPGRDMFALTAGASNISQPTGNGNSVKIGPEYTLSSGNWKDTFALSYLNERYNLTNWPITSTELVFPKAAIGYLKTDRPLQPKEGYHFGIQVSGASESVLSETNFFQSTAFLNTLYTIRDTHTRLLFRTQVGYTDISNLESLPLSLQLFAGGTSSVRGYDYNSIGPGRNLVVASTEIQQRIYKDFYLAGFVDAGNVANTQLIKNICVGIGPGIAWVGSIGTLELTVANAITQSNTPWAIQFTMGAPL